MMTLNHETRIAAPAMRVFLLSLSVDLHQDSAAPTSERAIAGVVQGILHRGQTVTWRGRHFGLMLEHTSLISRYEAPHFFEDAMVQGAFKSFRHQHTFLEASGVTQMSDSLTFCAPLGPLGWIAERLFLRAHLSSFIRVRNERIKEVAESDAWRRYIPSEALSL